MDEDVEERRVFSRSEAGRVAADRGSMSGTQVRAMLAAGQLPPPEFSRPEVATC